MLDLYSQIVEYIRHVLEYLGISKNCHRTLNV
jgi:hypothetical protein